MEFQTRYKKIKDLRKKILSGKASVGSWMQIPSSTVAEIMGDAGYDWVAVDLEHGSIGVHQLPDIFRALSVGGTLPLARLAQGSAKDCKQALDAGAAGVIAPMIESAEQLIEVKDACCWPPAGKRGVGFSRANMFGKYFDQYNQEAQAPLLVAQIEHIRAVDDLADILQVKGLDAVMVGPYDLSASMGITAKFNHPDFNKAMKRIIGLCKQFRVPCGEHIVFPDPKKLKERIKQGYRFIAYSIDAVFLTQSSRRPHK